jgi:methyl-accepting chemotaxis protein
MFFNDLKITTRLTISSVVFLLPIVVMLFLIVSISNVSIQSAQSEQKGIGQLKPIAGLLRAVPRRQRAVIDMADSNTIRIDKEIEELLKDMENQFDAELVLSLREELRRLSATEDVELMLTNYMTFISRIRELMEQTGGASGLVTDPGLVSRYLAESSFFTLPQIQERLLEIGNLLRRVHNRGVFSPSMRGELIASMTLLARADYPRAVAGLEVVIRESQNGTGVRAGEIAARLAVFQASIADLLRLLNQMEAGAISEQIYHSLLRSLNAANENAYVLWYNAAGQLEIALQNRIDTYTVRLVRSLAIAALASALAFIIIGMTNRNIFRSTGRLKELFRGLEQNNLSLSFDVDSRDEFGELTSGFNRFLEKLRAAFVHFDSSASLISSSAYDLAASAKEISTTSHEQSSSVAEIVSTMEGNKNLSEQVAVKAHEVAELAVGTEELSRRGAELREVNQDMMQDIRDQNSKIIQEIRNLADMIGRIDDAVTLIDTIADQTKLIAFNAALEASSAGEAGARFAVVAGEIRRFAGNVVETTGEIKQRIEEIQDASRVLIAEAGNGTEQINQGYDRLVEQKTVFEHIVDISQNVTVRIRQISNLSKQQEFATGQIFTALKEISAGVSQFVTATASTSKIADNLNEMSVELRETMAKYRTGEKGEKYGS